MKHSVERILTTHAGSLPRPPELLDLIKSGDSAAFENGANAEQLRDAVSAIVRRQVALGIDVVDDGEYGKPSFVSYINERLGGYEVDTRAGPRNARRFGRRSVHAGNLAVQYRRLAEEHVLQVPRGVRVRHSRGDARRIQGDRRRWPTGADR